jgi:class 3 adenylate cyclase
VTDSAEQPRGRILVVEDTVANIQMLSASLKNVGYQVAVATNGAQALEAVARLKPDLILLDIEMPVMDGFETCRALKQSGDWRDIPVIFLTSRADPDDIVKGFELGAVDYLSKPFNAHELLARVNTHLTVDELRRSLAEKNAELGRAHELVRRAFGRYVSEEVAETLLTSPEGLELGGEERVVTILMSDLRGFTALASRRKPQEVIACLNIYLEAAVDVITRYQGTIDEIIGDGILVIFGAPVSASDHADRAVACAIDMQRAMVAVNERLSQLGVEPLELGIGIHSGPVVVGNIGSMRRTKYAAVGANVNMAGRIESFTTGGQVLVSEDTKRLMQAQVHTAREFDVEPKGASRIVRLLDVKGIDAPWNLRMQDSVSVVMALQVPVTVSFTVMEEKFVGRDSFEGSIIGLSPAEGHLVSEHAVAPLSDVRMTLKAGAGGSPGGEIYGKMIDVVAGTSAMRIRFTKVAPELREWLRSTGAGG